MKKILKLAFIILFTSVYSQNISDYTFVYIAEKTGDFEANKYGLATLLSAKLTAKKYVVIAENNDSWPEVAKKNPCRVLKAELADTSTFLKNKLQINFRDCSGKTVASYEAKSNIKEYEPGFKDALNTASKIFPGSNPVQLAAISQTETPKQTAAASAEPVKSAPVQTKNSGAKTENKAQTFSNGTLNLNRIFISDSQFILASPNDSTPYAIFKESTKKEMYRVQLQDGSQTLGYVENGNIVIELPNADGSYRKDVFGEAVILAY